MTRARRVNHLSWDVFIKTERWEINELLSWQFKNNVGYVHVAYIHSLTVKVLTARRGCGSTRGVSRVVDRAPCTADRCRKLSDPQHDGISRSRRTKNVHSYENMRVCSISLSIIATLQFFNKYDWAITIARFCKLKPKQISVNKTLSAQKRFNFFYLFFYTFIILCASALIIITFFKDKIKNKRKTGSLDVITCLLFNIVKGKKTM